MATPAPAPAPAAATPEFVVPEGIDLQYQTGKVTGKPMYRVVGFEMPWAGTEQAAVELYQRLTAAYGNGYFAGSAKKPAGTH